MMYQRLYLPEGTLLQTEKNKRATGSLAGLSAALEQGTIVEGIVTLCDAAHNLEVSFGEITGIIPRAEAALGLDGATREIAIISRVGKPVACRVMGISEEDGRVLLSRREAQNEALRYLLEHLRPGDLIPARVTHLEQFGAFVDVGCGNVALIGIENISVSRIAHPRDRFVVGQEIYGAVLSVEPESARITLTHRELLGTWAENVARFEVGQTVRGIVRGVEEYGAFVELAPNLSGLAERREGVHEGDHVSVFLKNIAYDKMKIKLIVIDVLGQEESVPITRADYFLTEGHLTQWQYSPEACTKKKIETIFE